MISVPAISAPGTTGASNFNFVSYTYNTFFRRTTMYPTHRTIFGPFLSDLKKYNIPYIFLGKNAHGQGMYEVPIDAIDVLKDKCPLYVIGQGWV